MEPAREEGWKEDAQRGTLCLQGRDAVPRGRLEALTWQSKKPLCPAPAAREPSHPRDCPIHLQGHIHWCGGMLPTGSREGGSSKMPRRPWQSPFFCTTLLCRGKTHNAVTSLCNFCSIFPLLQSLFAENLYVKHYDCARYL